MDEETSLFWLTAMSIIIQSTMIHSASLDEAKTLHSNMTSGYNKYVRPVTDQTQPVAVQVSLSVIAIQEFDEVLEKFSVVGVLILTWKDANMVWDAADYGGKGNLFMGYKQVWVPELILSNPSEKLDSFGKEWQLIRYSSDGNAAWYPGDFIKATCSIDVRYFPFDIQECSMEFYVWGYSTFEVKLNLTRTDIDTGMLSEHGSWKVIGTSAKVEDVNFVSKATFTFRLERKPQYIIFNVVLPILFLCLLDVLVFVLPAESGERVSYAITVLLSIAVFMTIVSATLPKTSEPLPIISYFLMLDLIISALISLFTVLNLRLFHKKDNIPIPKRLTSIYNFLSCHRRRRIDPYQGDGSRDNKLQNKGHFENLKKTKQATPDNGGVTKIQRLDSDMGSESEHALTWQDISTMVDYMLLIIFSFITILSFILFLVVTKVQ